VSDGSLSWVRILDRAREAIVDSFRMSFVKIVRCEAALDCLSRLRLGILGKSKGIAPSIIHHCPLVSPFSSLTPGLGVQRAASKRGSFDIHRVFQ
jgi:hypothetical protein